MGDDQKKPTTVEDLRTKHDVIGHYGSRQVDQEIPDWLTRSRSGIVRAQVETRRDLGDVPNPVPPRDRDRLIKRTRKDIFGGKESQDWYVDHVKEALENISPTDLYQFICDHNSYDNKESYKSWNADFAALVEPQMSEVIPSRYKGQTDEMTHRRITAAFQHFLVSEYKNDIFQITRKKVNPWIFIDGRMGPYTVSVMAEWWNKNFDNTQFSDGTYKVADRSGLGTGYVDDKKAHESYDKDAMHHLDVQTGEGKPDEKDDKDKDKKEAPPQNADEKAKAYYKKHDQAGETCPPNVLLINNKKIEKNMNLSEALAECYGEKDLKKSKNSPKTFRMLNLLAQQMGAKIDSYVVQAGSVISFGEDIIFTITPSNGSNPLSVNLSSSQP